MRVVGVRAGWVIKARRTRRCSRRPLRAAAAAELGRSAAEGFGWLNRIEIWFGILSRRVIRRGAFRSTADLRDRILKFIDYYNATMAKPFKRTYAGRPLNV